jgi:hypothetical protein
MSSTNEPSKEVASAPETGARYLIRHIETTRAVRYAIARRLRREKTCARVVVSFLSLIIIGSSVGSLVFSDQLGRTQVTVVSIINIVISAYIIIMNYEFDRRDFDRQIMSLEKSTSRLRELYYAVKNLSIWNQTLLRRHTETYNTILREHTFQTEERDYNYVLLVQTHLRGENYKSPRTPFWLRCRHQYSHFFLAAVWNLIPIVLICAAIFVLIRYPNASDGTNAASPSAALIRR